MLPVAKHTNPNKLRVGGLYQLLWRNVTVDKTLTTIRLNTIHVGRAGEYQQTLYVSEPVLVIELDMYVCRVLTSSGERAWFSYSDYANTREYKFREVKEGT